MDIFGADNRIRRYFWKCYYNYNFDQKKQYIWYYMVTNPGKTVQCPLEGSGIAIYMNSVHKYYIYFCLMQL